MSDFFQQLYAVARHTPMTLLITPRGDRLHVIVTPKPSGDAGDNPGFAQPIVAIGTPAELDAELGGKVREYGEKVNDVRASIKLPIEAVDAERNKATKKSAAKDKREEKKKAAASAAAKKTADRKAAKDKRIAEAKAKKDAAKAKRDAKKGTKPPAGGQIKLPGKSTAKPAVKPAAAKKAAPAPKAKKPAATGKLGPRSLLPGKPECIADYKALSAKLGTKLSRKSFIKGAVTKRRYEKLWDSWEAFIAAAAQLELPLDSATGAYPAGAGVSTSVAVSRTQIIPEDAWPFPGSKGSKAQAADSALESPPDSAASAVLPPAAAEPPLMPDVVDQAGELLFPSAQPRLTVGQIVTVPGHGNFPIREIVKVRNKISCNVETHYVIDAWPVFDLSWKPLGFWHYHTEPKVGDTIMRGSDDQEFRVIEVDGDEIMASPVKPRVKGPIATAASTETN
jgi:PRTRC genetic system protein E